MTSIVWAPADLIIASNQGVAVRFAGVEVTSEILELMGPGANGRGIRVHLAGARGQATMERDSAYVTALEAWAKERTAHGKEEAGPRPIMPGETVLTPVQAVITDNHETEYRRVGGRVAGTGTEWSASWDFVPEPPPGVKHLSLEFTLHGELTGKSVRIQLD
ncbi:hypothetical protein [Arthrobacter sp. lap29]|uniref:hypothetical protein n=1 Tax=Arthrobacter sp. lap29 TaxID=3056122 RepID=UPI0028F6E3C5|nr:hypothetical protein [Arthrobacter sp. lap29]